MAKNALQLRYNCYSAMSDLLRFEIFQVFYSKMFVMCVYETIDALKLALGCQIALEAKW